VSVKESESKKKESRDLARGMHHLFRTEYYNKYSTLTVRVIYLIMQLWR